LNNQKSSKAVSKGISARFTNAVLMLVGCFLAILILLFSNVVRNKYISIIDEMNDYAECNKALNDFRDSSSYLTNQARSFSINLNSSYLDNYFYEKNDLKRRESAVEIIELTHKNDAPDTAITMALRESNLLCKKEMYAMKLVCEALGIDITTLPDEIIDLTLKTEDIILSNDKKIEKARALLFDSEYIECTDKIDNYCNNVSSTLVNMYLNEQNITDVTIKYYFKNQIVVIFILLFVVIALYASLVLLVIIPLKNNCRSIEKGSKMIVKGCSEVRLISRIFNNLYDKNALAASDLKHKAEHDPLTGLINRNGFNQIKDVLRTVEEPIAYLIVDIDFFKSINDTYGHLVGDEVLKRISNLLSEQFRNSDYVARIGGDEFAVIMTKIGTTPVSIIQRKIDNMNKSLQEVSEDFPKVSLSVGVAFSDSGFINKLEDQADKALYKVKKGGRCNCSFYDNESEE